MPRRMYFIFFLIFFSFFLALSSIFFVQRAGYTREEILRRRNILMDEVDKGMIILFGESLLQPGSHFRQDNDFYYFTGIEDPYAVLVMAPKTEKVFLFLPRQAPREEKLEGPNLLKDEKAKARKGLADIYPLDYLDEFIARNASRLGQSFYLRMAPRDYVDNARRGNQIFTARKNRIHYNDQISLDNYRIKKLRERYPSFAFRDITPIIDSMRLIKTPEEIAILRRNGKISAEAIKQAMLATKPGVYEYELEAAAVYTILKHGARGPAYPPIVG